MSIEGRNLKAPLHLVILSLCHDGDLCPGQVLDLDEGDYQVSTMVRRGRYWKWLENKDGIWYTRSAVQRKVAPPEEIGMCHIF